jgi:hypothetical protein
MAACASSGTSDARSEQISTRLAAVEAKLANAPKHSDTLQKAAARIDLLYSMLEFQDAVKANWWCGSFVCVRTEALCNAIEDRSGVKREECIPRRNVFCRGLGKPLLGASTGGKTEMADVMSCHALRADCERLSSQTGDDCFGLE